jgi:hypothetical protein
MKPSRINLAMMQAVHDRNERGIPIPLYLHALLRFIMFVRLVFRVRWFFPSMSFCTNLFDVDEEKAHYF